MLIGLGALGCGKVFDAGQWSTVYIPLARALHHESKREEREIDVAVPHRSLKKAMQARGARLEEDEEAKQLRLDPLRRRKAMNRCFGGRLSCCELHF